MVSVIVPAYNCRITLERAILSVVNDPLVSELLVIDDGSLDGSKELALGLAERFPIVQAFGHKDGISKGASATRNLGLAKANSNWIQFLDADDELLEGKIEKQLAKAHEGVSFVVGNAIDCFDDGREHFRRFLEDPWAGLIAGKLGITSANLWNRQALNAIGGWNESLSSSQEYDLMFRLLKENSQVSYSMEFLTIIHKRPNSISQNTFGKPERIKNWLKLRIDIKSFLKSKGLFNISRNYIYSGYLLSFCRKNDCIQEFDGSRVLGELFRIEKKIKTRVFNLIKT